MKKKKIETVSPVELRKPKRKYYMMAAAAVELDGEKHLICDFYRKERRSQIFILRAAYTQHDWGLWNPVTGKWSRGSIENCYFKPAYDECDRIDGPGIPEKACWTNTSTDAASVETMRDFYESMSGKSYIHDEAWSRFLTGIESQIKRERDEKRELARSKKLAERIRDLPEIPNDYIIWADSEVFRNKEYVYYKRRGRYADCRCSHCSWEYTIKTQRSEAFLGQFEDIRPVPKNGYPTQCPRCGAVAIYKPVGRMKDICGEKRATYLIQPFRGTGAVIRYIEVSKEWSLTEDSQLYFLEIGREYWDGGKRQVDWHLYDHYTGKTEWYDRNMSGIPHAVMPRGCVYTRNINEWTSSDKLRYSGLEQFIQHKGTWMKPTRYLQEAELNPLERLVKMNLYELVEEIVEKGNYLGDYVLPYPHAKKIENALGVRRCRLRMLSDAEGNIELLRALQAERENTEMAIAGKRKGKGEWTDEQIRKIKVLHPDRKALRATLKYMSITQYINRIERYEGQPIPEYEQGHPGCWLTNIRGIAQEYMDYIRMREESGYGMDRLTDIFPRDLKEAHRQMVHAQNEKENDIRAEKYRKEFPDIRKKYRELKATYGYKSDGLFVRPAKDPREIIEEGQILHHCVGRGEYYIRKHNSGQSYILFLRHTISPNDPYITIEIEGKRIRQWYGINDTKPDKDLIERWLAEWIDHVAGKDKPRAEEALTSAAG